MRRVVVTGLGMVTPLGADVASTWKNMLDGKSGAGTITRFDASDLPTRIAFEVKEGDGSNGTLVIRGVLLMGGHTVKLDKRP